MANKTPREIKLSDPLSEVARRERKFLLASSILGIAMVKAGIVPSKISALGIEFAKTDQNLLLSVIGIIILYFLVAFLIYAASDIIIWHHSFSQSLKASMVARWKSEAERDPVMEIGDYIDDFLRRPFSVRFILGLTTPVSLLRAIFEFLLPVTVGIYAIGAIWAAINQ